MPSTCIRTSPTKGAGRRSSARSRSSSAALDVMVANAGIAIRVPIVDMTLADWRRQQAVNLEGVFLVGQVCRAGHAALGRRLHRHHVVAGGPARRGGARRLLCHQGRACGCSPRPRPSSTRRTTFASTPYIPGIIDTDIWSKMVAGSRRRPAQRADRHPRAVARLRAAVAGRGGAGHRRRCALPRVPGLGLHDGSRTRHRRRHVRRRHAAVVKARTQRIGQHERSGQRRPAEWAR